MNLEQFRNGENTVMCATDIISRGVDTYWVKFLTNLFIFLFFTYLFRLNMLFNLIFLVLYLIISIELVVLVGLVQKDLGKSQVLLLDLMK